VSTTSKNVQGIPKEETKDQNVNIILSIRKYQLIFFGNLTFWRLLFGNYLWEHQRSEETGAKINCKCQMGKTIEFYIGSPNRNYRILLIFEKFLEIILCEQK